MSTLNSQQETPPAFKDFRIGVSEDMNRWSRRTMEDSHSYQLDFPSPRSGFFGIFDGHAGKSAAQWCGNNLHTLFERNFKQYGKQEGILSVLNRTFMDTNEELGKKNNIQSGCTAVVAFIQSEYDVAEVQCEPESKQTDKENDETGPAPDLPTNEDEEVQKPLDKDSNYGSADDIMVSVTREKRVLYCANAGDARAILSRNGKAVRITYDHKGNDPQEIKRIIEAGGFIMNSRVNGVLAVTRSLGDESMKDLIVSNPYCTQVILDGNDEFLILACDGIWDVVSDQDAVDLVAKIKDPQQASDILVKHALDSQSTDNLSCMVIRFCDDRSIQPQ